MRGVTRLLRRQRIGAAALWLDLSSQFCGALVGLVRARSCAELAQTDGRTNGRKDGREASHLFTGPGGDKLKLFGRSATRVPRLHTFPTPPPQADHKVPRPFDSMEHIVRPSGRNLGWIAYVELVPFLGVLL